MLKHLTAVGSSLVLGLVGAAVLASPAQAEEQISCSTTTGSSDFYHGPSASAMYDNRFSGGPVLPDGLLDGWIPQGLGTWPNYGGPGKDLLLVSAYNDDRDHSVIIGIVPGGGHTRTVKLPKSHVGGVAVVKGHLYVSGPGKSIQRFSLSELRYEFSTAAADGALSVRATRNLGSYEGDSFLSGYRGVLYAGTFDSGDRSTMYRYLVADDGSLNRVGDEDDYIQVPTKTQGLLVTRDHFIYSTSWTSEARGNIYVVNKQYKTLDGAYPQDLRCFRAPSMGQGITASNGRAYLLFESGSYKYRGDECNLPQPIELNCTRNIITRLHKARLSSLTSLV